MVFARRPDAGLASLVKKLDEALAEHADKKLAAFVNLMGSDEETAMQAAKEFAEKQGVERVAIVVPKDLENGPANFNISPESDVTVMLYVGQKVRANHAFAADKLTDEAVAQVLSDLPKILE